MNSKAVDGLVDPRTRKLAKLVVEYCVEVKREESVFIQGHPLAFPLINEIYRECLIHDAYPMVMAKLDLDYTFYKHAKDHQLKYISPIRKFIIENIDVLIGIACQSNTRALANVDPAKIRMEKEHGKELLEIYLKRSAEGKLRWNGVAYPSSSQAQEAAMSLEEYEDFVYSSCLVDKKDPVAEWKRIKSQQKKICDFLRRKRSIHIVGDETDLTLNVEGRKWINSDGKRNMPSGEVFTAPLENSASGTIKFSYPGIYLGREVEDVSLTFKDGKVIHASAIKGNDLLQQIMKVEGADRIGEVAIGTNYGITKFTKLILFDEKMGGTIHIALGAAYPEAGGRNKSAIHWDILKDMKKDATIYADDKPFYKDGQFLI